MKKLILASILVLARCTPAMAEDYDPVPKVDAGVYSQPSQTPLYEPYKPKKHYKPHSLHYGSKGYNGVTGRNDRVYIPYYGQNPNPSPNVMGQ